ncbi:hypothetical protein JX265_009628 [Neoarthrinium moseri]|uniref:Thioredoxin domain-containing protein n=1 Tax=Neoarthrinium moseri TaxID=1658444 RepID=A0A9P9WFN2_9PEZI|nr:hypothetical protein JX266_009782 [Neoarthrinium moseri]KAI1861009.1 hypothetical protein JX265_009628 [Neoarthrinium moseri]
MVACTWIVSWLATLVVCANAWGLVSPIELESKFKESSLVAVAFIAPSEAKSQSLETQWEGAASEANIPLLSIDCVANADACKPHTDSAYPTVKLFNNGEATSKFQGPRRATAILAWLERTQRPVLSDVDITSLTAFRSADETVFIAYIDPEDVESRAVFQDVAEAFSAEFTFGISTDAESRASEELQAPAIKCYKPIDGDTKVFKGKLDQQSLESFVKEASRPIIGELLPHTHQRFLDREWPMVYVFAETEAERTELRQSLKKLARSQYESLTMVTVDPLEFPELPAKLGLEAGVFPSGAVHQLSTNRIYPYPKGQPINSRALQQWGLDVWQGRIDPWTPAGATPVPRADTPGRIKATRKVSMRSFPGMKINIGRDEL